MCERVRVREGGEREEFKSQIACGSVLWEWEGTLGKNAFFT